MTTRDKESVSLREHMNIRGVLIKALQLMYWRCNHDAESQERTRRWAIELAEVAGIDADDIRDA